MRRVAAWITIVGAVACGSSSRPSLPGMPAAREDATAPAPPPMGTGGQGGGAVSPGLPGDAAPPGEDAGAGADAGVAPDAAVTADAAALGPFPAAAVKAARAESIASVPTQVEGPSWRDGNLFFAADGAGFGLMRLSADGKLFRYQPKLAPIGSYELADGSILFCDHALVLVQLFVDGKVAVLQTDYQGQPIENCNDVTIDGAGNLYLSARHTGFIYRVSPAGEVVRVAGGLGLTNGVEVDPASKFVYFAAGGTLVRVALPASGSTFGKPEMLMGVNADGMQFDAWGNLWMAVFPTGLRVYDPQSRQSLAMLGTGGTPTNLIFGGKDADTIYVTNGGKGIARIGPIAGMRGFLHPGAPKYAIKRMLDLVPADLPK